MKLSERGRDLIQEFEGLEVEAYQDGGGVWTIGIGHTKNVSKGDKITVEQALDWFADDVAWAEKAVNWLVKVRLSQNQFDSLVSLVFNIGESQFKNSTLLKVLNGGDYLGVPQEIVRWNKDNGKRVKGLLRRRLAEASQWLS